ncbi:PKD domain-containing protein [Nonomuraea sp. NPDC050394]|uniref:PKD domain-containing protein n=1 Tax=Nonomuraea sp. NPDC050394 TaxID=3364363 RepID=UPI0037B6C02F
MRHLVATILALLVSLGSVIASASPSHAGSYRLIINYHCTGSLAGANGVDLEVSVGTVEPKHFVEGTLTADWTLTYTGLTRFGSPGFYAAGSQLVIKAKADLTQAWDGILYGSGSSRQHAKTPGDPLTLPTAVSDSAYLSRAGSVRIEAQDIELTFLSPFGEATGHNATCVNNGATMSLSVLEETNSPPIAQFTHTCNNQTMTCSFNAAGSADTDGSIASYAWSFGDGSTGTGVSPSRKYAAPGSYRIRLTVTDNKGAASSYTQTVSVSGSDGAPIADFQVSCDQPTRFCGFDASQSVDTNGTIAAYSWNFGDGASGSGKTASHIYSSTGTYSVTLTVRDNDSLNTTATKQVVLGQPGSNKPPTARFDWLCFAAPGCRFDATPSTDSDGTIVAYQWDFGNGATSAEKVAFYKYPAAGSYIVKLTVTDDKGAQATYTQQATMPGP